MTNQDVMHRLEEIRLTKGDPENAHKLQDLLFIETLTWIGECCMDKKVKSLAKWALKVRKIRFDRWYA